VSSAMRAWRATGDVASAREAVRLRVAAVAERAGHPVTPSVFGRPITASSAYGVAELFEEVFLTGQYAVDLGPAPYIIDGGANIGLSVLYFRRRHPDSTILAFEPSRVAFEHLRRNAVGLEGVRLEQAALGEHDGTLELWTDGTDTVHAGRTARGSSDHTETVPMRRLSPFIDRSVDLLKLDIEGAEGDVLADLVKSGAIARVASIVAEYHHHLCETSLGRFISILETADFGVQVATSEDSAVLPPNSYQDVYVYAYR
jgi:FkbM family methyltransferase